MADYGSTDRPHLGALRLSHKCSCHAYILKFGDKRMKRLIEFLLSGCFHKWETIDKGSFSWKSDISEGSGTRYTLRCERCGEIKKRDIK
jgi:hypothetical protein